MNGLLSLHGCALRQAQDAILLKLYIGTFRKSECPSVPPVAGLLVSYAFRIMACHEPLDQARGPELVEGQIISSQLEKIMRRVAEREGFEPSIRLLGIYSLSRRAPSADSAISPEKYSAECRVQSVEK